MDGLNVKVCYEHNLRFFPTSKASQDSPLQLGGDQVVEQTSDQGENVLHLYRAAEQQGIHSLGHQPKRCRRRCVTAQHLKVPYPILLVIAGLLLSFLPEMPLIGLDPNLVFLVFLPPLLYSAAWTLSWREFQRNFVSIAMLAVGLVLFTVVGLALAAGSLLPDFDWKAAVLLGAVVAATDADCGDIDCAKGWAAAANRGHSGSGEPGERWHWVAGAAVWIAHAGNGSHTIGGGRVGRLVFLTGGGVLVGLAIGAVVAWFEKWVDDGPIEIVISILVPYAAYLMGDRAHVSGVIAVIACSMYMSRKSTEYMSPQVRLQATACGMR
jgi:monovalent cation/hydrogen antiporter